MRGRGSLETICIYIVAVVFGDVSKIHHDYVTLPVIHSQSSRL